MKQEQLELELRAARRRIAELEALRVSDTLHAEERWRFTLEGMGDGLWDWNPQTNHVFFSRSWKAMLGYAEDEIGDSREEWSTRVHPDDLAGALANVNDHLAGQTPFYVSEHRLRCKDGSYKWILERGKVMGWTADLQPMRVIGTHKDITARKQAEQALLQNERHYHSLIDALDVSLCRWRPDTTLTYTNERYRTIFGVAGDGIGQQWLHFLPEETRAATAAFYADVAKHPRTVTYEHPVMVEDHSVREYQWIDTPILDERGEVFEFQSVGIDITERIWANTLNTAQRDLARLSSAGSSKEEVWKACFQIALRAARLDCGAVFLFNPEARALELVHHEGLGAECAQAMARYPEDAPAAQAAPSDTITFLAEADLGARHPYRAEGLRALAMIPIHHHDQIAGVFYIGSHRFAGVPASARAMLESLKVELRNAIIHQQTEAALQASRKQLSQTLITARMGTWRWHIPTNHVEWSPEASHIVGINTNQSDFHTALEHFHPEDRGQLTQSIQESFARKGMLRLEYRIIDANGQIVWLTNYGNVEYDADGRPLSATGLVQDITDRKKAEQALQKSRARLQEAQRLARIGDWEWDLQAQTLTWSDEVYRIFGLSPASFTPSAEALEATIHPDDRADFLRRHQSMLDEKQFASIDYRIVLPDGKVHHVQERARLILDEHGGVVKVIGTVQDITERKQAEQARHESEQKYRDLLNGMNDTVWVVDDDMRILDVNNAATAMLGYTRDELLSMRILDIDPAFTEETIRNLIATMPRDRSQVFETCHIARDGRIVPVEISASLVAYMGKTVIMSIARDTTDRKQAQQQLHDSETRYQQFIALAFEGISRTEFDQPIDTSLPVEEQIDLIYARAYMAECNWALAEMYGTTAETMIGSRLIDVHRGSDNPINRAAFRKFIAGGYQSVANETSEFTVDGRPIWFISNTVGVVRDGKLVRMWETAMDITERKQAEADLRASEEKYRGLMESLDNAVSTVDADGRFLYMNDMAAEKLGGEPRDFIGKTIAASLPEPFAGRQVAAVRQIFTDDQKLVFEAQGPAGARLRWYRFTLQPIHDEHDRVSQVLINATDIHDLKMAQQELEDLNRTLEERVQERAAQVQDLYDRAPVGYHSLDSEGRLLAINQTELNWLGYTREELLGRPITTIYTPQTAAIFPALFARFKATGQISNQEAELVRKDGTTFPVMINATAIYDEHGQYVSSRSSMTDITERKQAEHELTRNVNFTKALLNAIPTPVFYKDKAGLYQGCNLAFVEITGATAEQIRGKTVYELWPGPNANLYHLKDLELMQSGERQVYESMITDKDGNVRPVIFIKDIFYDESGGVAGLVGAFVDITERKRIEETLQMANAELQRAMRIKDEFLASMSHELRTPLNAILGLSQSLIEQFVGPLNDRQLRSMQTIDASGRHLLALINDILDLSKVSANQMTLELAPIVVRELCDASLLFVREAARTKHLQVTSVLDPAAELMEADERRLKQILVNLLSNAVKFTPEGGAVELRVTGHRERQAIDFSVSDTGIGIAPEHIGRLFQPFVQLDSGLNRQFEGTGLGLSLVARMTELHGGSVSVESEPGRGSTFTITLPWVSPTLSPAAPNHQPATPAPAMASALPPGSKAPLILIAEDHESNIAMLSTYLQARGYQLAIARNGDEALRYARARRPDLILMDLQMPVLDGLEATRRLRSESDPQVATIPVLALTALAMPADRRRALEAGANDYLSKPVDLNQLADLISRLIGGR